MASASVSASMAASGFDKRYSSSTTSSLMETPGSGTFPSEIARSPMACSPGFLRNQEAMRTPLTPPSAYLDFLKQMTPAMPSPMSTGRSSRFHFGDEKCERLSEITNDKPATSASPPDSQPALSRNTSYESNLSNSSTNTSVSDYSAIQTAAARIEPPLSARIRPESPRIVIPPSPHAQFAKPGQPRSSRTPKRLQIPTSPFSPNNGASPYSSTPLSGAPWSASFSPSNADPEANGKPGRVSVRHTVTRTIVYCRTPLEPAPRGKRRKVDDSAYPQTAFPRLSELPFSRNNDSTADSEKKAAVEDKAEKMEDVQKDKTESSPEIKQEIKNEAAAAVVQS
ncbi:hypothetical protein MRB53_042049 [Persea americana]|nr:hypothetical protein MRB53_042049 [Persea americana]